MLWEKILEKLAIKTIELNKRQQSALTNKLMHSIYFINHFVHKRILQLYLARQNQYHAIRFLCWIVMSKLRKQVSHEDLARAEDSIRQKVAQLFEIDCLLFKDCHLPQFLTQTQITLYFK